MKSPIIDPEGTVAIGPIPHTYIHGGKGSHGQDLIRRWLIPSGTKKHPAHFLTLPITIMERAVLELLDQGALQQNIISFAGVMAKVPNGIPSAHFLFGPGSQWELKMALATETFDSKNTLVKSLIKRVREKKIEIIETTKVEHDSKMAIIQWLINLWLIMIGKNQDEDIRNRLLIPWKTPVGTVVDMIHANPFAEIIIKEFFESLPHHRYNVSQALASLIGFHLKDQDIKNFWTPNSDRVIQFIWKIGSNIVIPKNEITVLRKSLNTHGHKFLAKKIGEIREGV